MTPSSCPSNFSLTWHGFHFLWHPTGGDHLIVVGRVQRFPTDDRPPLLFYLGRYATPDAKPQALANLARMVAAVA